VAFGWRVSDDGVWLFAWCWCRNLAACSDEQELVSVSAPVSGADFVFDPDVAGFVAEAPGFHDQERVFEHGHGGPKEEGGILGGGDFEVADLLGGHFRVVIVRRAMHAQTHKTATNPMNEDSTYWRSR
jgi:hypothetical protein